MSTNINGTEWKEYSISWVDQITGRPMESSIFAMTAEHARTVVESMKSTLKFDEAEIVGRVYPDTACSESEYTESDKIINDMQNALITAVELINIYPPELLTQSYIERHKDLMQRINDIHKILCKRINE